MEESEGFEPSEVLPSPVFKTGAINHSANFPFVIVPVSYDSRYNESVSNHVTNKYNGAYASNVIIVRSCFVVTETSQRVFPYLPNFLHKKRDPKVS